MCLNKVFSVPPKRFLTKRVGYKVFAKSIDGLTGVFTTGDLVRPTEKWIDEKDFRFRKDQKTLLPTYGEKRYPTGWHIYLSREDARFYKGINNTFSRPLIIKKVLFRNPIVYGEQGSNVVVAREIFITNDKV